MNITDIIKNGLSFPTNNWTNVIIIGVIFLVVSLIGRAGAYTNNKIILGIAAIVSIIVAIILKGYKLDVVNAGIEESSDIPLPRGANFVAGIKSIIVSIVYYIIPAIVVAIIGYVTGVNSGVKELSNYVNIEVLRNAAISNPNIINETLSSVPHDVLSHLFSAAMITIIIGIILFFIFSIVEVMAQGKLAETGNLGAALSIGNAFKKAGSVGWGKIIAYLIVLFIVLIVIGFISGLITMIPIIGAIIAAIIIAPFIYLFQNYSIGLLYNSDE